MRWGLLLISVAALAACGVLERSSEGGAIACLASAVDGDSIHCDDELIRIAGIDAPETTPAQTCERRLGMGNMDRELALGQAAEDALQGLLDAEGPQVLLTEVDRTSDRYGRPLARVWIGEIDVAAWMIQQRHAVAYDGGRRDAWCEE